MSSSGDHIVSVSDERVGAPTREDGWGLKSVWCYKDAKTSTVGKRITGLTINREKGEGGYYNK